MAWLIVSSLLWSLSFGLIKASVAGLDPLLVAAIRLALSALAFAPLVRRFEPPLVVRLAAIGFVQFGLMYSLYIAAYQSLAGHQIAILTVTTPLFVALIDGVLARKLSGRIVAGALLAVLGGAVIAWDDRAGAPDLRGLLLVQSANLCFAAGQVAYGRFGGRPAKDAEGFGWMYAGGLLAPLLLLLIGGRVPALPAAAAQWASLAYLGLIPSALGFFLWNKGVARTDTGTAAVMNNLKIPAAVVLAWVLFGERLDPLEVAASGALLALGLWVARKR